MKYKKKVNEALDAAFTSAVKHGMNIRFADDTLFFRKGFHWEYILRDEVTKMHRRVEEVISHTSCCAENMDIQRLIATLKNGDVVSIHVCDGEPRLAERLYDDIQNSWKNVEFGTNS